MSQAALALAARDRIRTVLGVDDKVCRFMPDGRPASFAGQEWISVHLADGNANEIDAGLDEYYGFCVTVTLRAAYSPADQMGEEVLVKAATGLETTAEAIRAALHDSYDVLAAANAIIGAGHNGFTQPPRSLRPVKPRPVYPDWFSAESRQGNKVAAGFAVELIFHKARRMQAPGPEMT